jgi:hypothetical protein
MAATSFDNGENQLKALVPRILKYIMRLVQFDEFISFTTARSPRQDVAIRIIKAMRSQLEDMVFKFYEKWNKPVPTDLNMFVEQMKSFDGRKPLAIPGDSALS